MKGHGKSSQVLCIEVKKKSVVSKQSPFNFIPLENRTIKPTK